MPREATGENKYLTAMVFFGAMHLGCLGVLWLGITWRGIGILAASYFLRVFFMGVGLHRYFAHRCFRTSRPVQLVMAILAMTGMQGGPLWWAQTHRYHHQHADTPEDLHSPAHQGFWYSHCVWFFLNKNRRTDYSQIRDLARYPELMWLDRPLVAPTIGILYGALLFWQFQWEGLIWGFFIATVANWHLVHSIQSVSHSWGGYRRFATRDHSRNHWLMGLVSLGEYHNNHHYAPSSARQGYAWWEIDLVYWALCLMRRLGLVWDLKTAPVHSAKSLDLSPTRP